MNRSMTARISEHDENLFVFDATQIFTDLRQPLSENMKPEDEAWFQEVHPMHYEKKYRHDIEKRPVRQRHKGCDIKKDDKGSTENVKLKLFAKRRRTFKQPKWNRESNKKIEYDMSNLESCNILEKEGSADVIDHGPIGKVSSVRNTGAGGILSQHPITRSVGSKRTYNFMRVTASRQQTLYDTSAYVKKKVSSESKCTAVQSRNRQIFSKATNNVRAKKPLEDLSNRISKKKRHLQSVTRKESRKAPMHSYNTRDRIKRDNTEITQVISSRSNKILKAPIDNNKFKTNLCKRQGLNSSLSSASSSLKSSKQSKPGVATVRNWEKLTGKEYFLLSACERAKVEVSLLDI